MYILQGEDLEFVARHLVGVEASHGNRALSVTATSAPDATVLAMRLSEVYNPYKVVGADGSSDTFLLYFPEMKTVAVLADIKGAVGNYNSQHPNVVHVVDPVTETVYVPVSVPINATQSQTNDATSTYVIVGAAALIIIMLLWED